MFRLSLAEALHKSLAEIEELRPDELRLWQAYSLMRNDGAAESNDGT